MTMRRTTAVLAGFILVLGVVAIVVLASALYSVDEAEQVIVLQFGAPVGDPIQDPGLHFKKPFIQNIRRFDKRILTWDGDPNQIPTKGREFIFVDTTARWRIVDPLAFYKSVQDERGAQSRLDDIIDSVFRDKISATELVEIVRSEDWDVEEADLEQAFLPSEEEQQVQLKQEVKVGRENLTRQVLEEAQKIMPQYGIELVDVRIKRLNYVESVQKQVFNRMISERQRVAEQFRSEGQGRSAEILGEMQRELAEIRSTAKKQAEIVQGEGDAEATRIYGEAYNAEPEFYAFLRTLESYSESINQDTILLLGVDSDYFRYLKTIRPPGEASGESR
jgi:membrane protease subunit HflC